MPKVEEFYPSRASRREPLGRTIIFIVKDVVPPGANAAQALALGE